MKKLPIFWLLVLFVSCHKDPPNNKTLIEVLFPGLETYGKCIASKKVPGIGQINWEASGIAVKVSPDLFDLKLGTVNEFNESRENLSFYNIPLTSGYYPIKEGEPEYLGYGVVNAGYYRSFADGDVSGANYFPVNDLNNFIKVAVDTIEKRAKGTFYVSFDLNSQAPEQNFPKRVIFDSAEFDVKFVK